MENNNMSSMNASDKKGSGALVGSIIIVVLLIIGGIYMYNRSREVHMMNEEMNANEMQNDGSQLNVNSTTTVDQSSQSNADDLDSIDKDLNDTDLNSLDE